MKLVTRIDAFRRVAGKEIHVEFQTADTLYHGQAFLFSDTRVDSTFIYDDISFGYNLSHGLTCSPKGFEIGAVILVNRRGYGYDIEIA